ncbi:hypothetical protein [Psychroserpens mesophilus]|uniref:hypothetical protein n=1 Tax=Psychroserpens mesophilus TaxID=325473 RepID=UPI003D64C983
MKERYIIIQDNLKKIKGLDPNFEAFGSSNWKYELHKFSELDISLFEKNNKINLPTEFREFIIELGFGASPVYGVNRQIFLNIDKWEIEAGEDEEDYEEYKPLYSEHIVIAEYGCGIESVIIVNGEYKGEIWHNSDYGLDKLNDSYYDWYLKWTENLLKVLNSDGHIGLLSSRI